MTIIIAKNVSGSEKRFLGVVLQDAEQITLSDFYSAEEIQADVTLQDFIIAGDIVMNDGTSDLPPAAGTVLATAVVSVNGKTGNVVLDPDDLDDSGTVNKFYPDADATKLAGIEPLADVTDADNVDAAGAVMESDTSVASMSFVIDDDTMATATDQVIPTAESVVAFVTALIAAISIPTPYQGGYNATTNTPDLITPVAGSVLKGHSFDVTFGGTFYGEELEIGDLIKARVDDPASLADWVILQDNLTAASIKTKYESNLNTNAFTDALLAKLNGIDANATDDMTGAEIAAALFAEPNTNNLTDALKAILDFITVTAPANLDTMQSDIAANNAKVTNATHTGDVAGSGALTIQPQMILGQLTALGLNVEHFADYFLFYDSNPGTFKRITGEELAKMVFLRSLWNFTISNGVSSNATATPVTKVTEQIPASLPSGTYLVRLETDWAQVNNNEIAIQFQMDQGGGFNTQKGVFNIKSNNSADWRPITKHFPVIHTNGQNTDLRMQFFAVGGSGNAQVRYSSIEYWRVY